MELITQETKTDTLVYDQISNMSWRSEYRELLRNTQRPPVIELKRILAKGLLANPSTEDRELLSLQKFVNRVNNWMEQVTNICNTGQRKRKRESSKNEETLTDISLLNNLVKELDMLTFDAPEIINMFKQMVSESKRLQSDAKRINESNVVIGKQKREQDIVVSNLPNGNAEFSHINKIKGDIGFIQTKARQLSIVFPELDQLSHKIHKLDWIERTYAKISTARIIFHTSRYAKPQNGNTPIILRLDVLEVVALIEEAVKLKINPENNEVLLLLHDLKLKAELWENDAKKLLNSRLVMMDDLEMLMKSDLVVLPIGLVSELGKIYNLGCRFRSSARILLQSTKNDFKNKLPATLLVQLLEESRTSPVNMKEISALKECWKKMEEWMNKGKILLTTKTGYPQSLSQSLTEIWSNVEACTRPIRRFDLCFCHEDAGNSWRVECQICRSKYHGSCLPKTQKLPDPYVCPTCCKETSFLKVHNRPSIDQIEAFLTSGMILPFKAEAETQLLHQIVVSSRNWQKHVNAFLSRTSVDQKNANFIKVLRMQFKTAESLLVRFDSESEHLRQVIESIMIPIQKPKPLPTPPTPVLPSPPPVKKRRSITSSLKKEENIVELYCICKQPFDERKPMIGCDFCEDWFHFSCVGLEADKVASIDKYACPGCEVRVNKPISQLDAVDSRKRTYSSVTQQYENPVHHHIQTTIPSNQTVRNQQYMSMVHLSHPYSFHQKATSAMM
ncbi:hypothetical protein HK096_011402 [Nowakowskiella sp. JEL0078]|nr:hypothetical protein HK096_011402 [Nowakowskiella sp. JEL0078]